MMFRASRDRRDDPFVEVKAVLLVLGASLGIAGMVNNWAWAVYIAIAIIALGIILRLISQRRQERHDDEEHE